MRASKIQLELILALSLILYQFGSIECSPSRNNGNRAIRKRQGSRCSSECPKEKSMVCSSGRCRCENPKDQIYDPVQDACVNLVQRNCAGLPFGAKCVTNSECFLGLCQCKSGFVVNPTFTCTPEGKQRCLQSDDCDTTKPGVGCRKGVCSCNNPAFKYHHLVGCILPDDTRALEDLNRKALSRTGKPLNPIWTMEDLSAFSNDPMLNPAMMSDLLRNQIQNDVDRMLTNSNREELQNELETSAQNWLGTVLGALAQPQQQQPQYYNPNQPQGRQSDPYQQQQNPYQQPYQQQQQQAPIVSLLNTFSPLLTALFTPQQQQQPYNNQDPNQRSNNPGTGQNDPQRQPGDDAPRSTYNPQGSLLQNMISFFVQLVQTVSYKVSKIISVVTTLFQALNQRPPQQQQQSQQQNQNSNNSNNSGEGNNGNTGNSNDSQSRSGRDTDSNPLFASSVINARWRLPRNSH